MKTKLTLFVTALAAALFGVGCASTSDSNKPADKGKSVNDPLRKGLVAYYPFNGNAKDESGNGNDGMVVGATLTNDRHNGGGKAYSFDGKSDVIGKEGGIEITGSMSVSAWVKTSSFDVVEGGRYRRIVVNKDKNDDNFGLSVISSGVGFAFYTTFEGKEYHAQFTAKKILAEKIVKEWVHVVGVFKGDRKIDIFINGELKTPLGDSGKFYIEKKHMFCIGNDAAPNRGCVGSIDDVRIYNRALSAEEVKALYDLEKPKGK